jgi:Ni2+-binding GTPase involved in maturation of urease and hydrogenase
MPLPVLLITGFLGGGKPTLLRRIAETRADLRMVFLVNELAGKDVDAGRLRDSGPETVSVVGGSIFCECKAADFLRMLREDVMPAHEQQPLDALVIETSGIADPSAIGTLIEKAGYGDALQVRSILTVLAPQSFRKLFGKLPVMEAQLRAADTILLNKCDLATPEQIADCRAVLHDLNPDARILETSFCQELPELNLTRSAPLPRAAFGKCSDLRFKAETLTPPDFADEAALLAWCGDAHRVKGIARVGGKLVEVDLTPEGLSLERSEFRGQSSGERAELVCIRNSEGSGQRSESKDSSPAPNLSPPISNLQSPISNLQSPISNLQSPIALLACDVFLEELEALGLPLPPTRWLEMGLHDRPDELRRSLQAEIDALDGEPGDEPGNEPILLLYGLCGGGLSGIMARRRPLVLPRAHDCIALLLGSNERHQHIQKDCIGTYFYSRGWIREKRVPGPDRADWLRELYTEKYDEDMIDELIEADHEAFDHYEQALFIRTPAAEEGESYCKRCAAHLGWRFTAEEADTRWLRDFLTGHHDSERFVTVAPGQTLAASGDKGIFA